MDKTSFLYGTLIASLIAIILCSCGPTREEWEAQQYQKIKNGEIVDGYDVKVIDGCEYLTAGSVPAYWHVITHKGNCKNQIHKTIKTP